MWIVWFIWETLTKNTLQKVAVLVGSWAEWVGARTIYLLVVYVYNKNFCIRNWTVATDPRQLYLYMV